MTVIFQDKNIHEVNGKFSLKRLDRNFILQNHHYCRKHIY